MNLEKYIERQVKWSRRVFGPDTRSDSILDHIKNELEEVREDPTDLEEWVDVMILAIDGAWRAGYTPEQISEKLDFKQKKNKKRSWPNWKTAKPGKALHHLKEEGL